MTHIDVSSNGHPAAVPGLRADHGGQEVGADPGDGGEVPGPAVVAQIRGVVAERLAARLLDHPLGSEEHRRELARGLVMAELADRRRARVRAGLLPWSRPTELQVATAVMAALF